jgi:uncharacterized protein
MITALKVNRDIGNYKLSRYLIVTDKFFSPLERQEKRIIFATRTEAVKIVTAKQWEHIYAGDFDSLSHGLMEALKASKIIVSLDEDELVSILKENRQAIANSHRLAFGVLPSADCQLDCSYCGQAHKRKKLSSDNQKLFLKRVRNKLERHPYRELKVCWTGAEPLLALDVIRKMSPKFMALAREFECDYISDIMTNGLLFTPKIAAELSRECGITLAEVTLDGSKLYHDKRRCGKNGMPTFGKILKNVIAIARNEKSKMKIQIRCNVDHRNYEGVPALMRELADKAVFNRLNGFSIIPVHDRGSLTDRIFGKTEEIASREIKWLEQMKLSGLQNINLIPHRLKKACFAIDASSEVVDAFGNLFNCADVISQMYEKPVGSSSKNGTGRNIFSIGSLSGGKNPGNRVLLSGFNDRIGQGEVPCGTCRVLPLCGGACPRRWLECDAPCPTFKYNIEKRLMLEYSNN